MAKTLNELRKEREDLKKELVKEAKFIKPFIENLRNKPVTSLALTRFPQGTKVANLGDKIIIDYKHLGIHISLTNQSFMIPDTDYMCYAPDDNGELTCYYCSINTLENFRLGNFE